jgi:hypothetical protein
VGFARMKRGVCGALALCALIARAPIARADGPVHSLYFPPPQVETLAPTKLSWDTSASLYSSYIFRGLELYDGLSLQPSVQPHIDLGPNGMLNAIVWAQVPLQGRSGGDQFFELDTGVSYDYTMSRATFSVGNYWYMFPSGGAPIPSRTEVWGSVALDTMLAPTFAVFYEYERYNMEYYEINLSHTFEKSGEGAFNVTFFADVGFAGHAEELYAENGLVQATYGASTAIDVSGVSVSPVISYTQSEDANTVNKVWGGLNAGYSF